MFLELNSASLEFLKISCFLLLENQAYWFWWDKTNQPTGIVVRNFTKFFLDLNLCSGSMGVFQKPWGCILCVAAYCRICIQLHMIWTILLPCFLKDSSHKVMWQERNLHSWEFLWMEFKRSWFFLFVFKYSLVLFEYGSIPL
jgi:hypothetical protein